MKKERFRPAGEAGGRRGGNGWVWLALAGAGVAAAYAASKLLDRDRGLPRLAPGPVTENEGPGAPIDELRLPADAEVSYVSGPAGSLRVAERHAGAPLAIVFVHGLGGRLEQWAPVLHRLGPGLHGVVFDLPGHGESDSAEGGDYSVPALAASIGAVAAALGLRRFVLAGHSLGGLVAIDYAGRHPERVAGLLLADASGDLSQLPRDQRDEVVSQVEEDPHGELGSQWRQILIDADPEVADRVYSDLEATAPGALAGALAGSLDYAPLEALDRYLGAAGVAEALITPLNSLPFSLHRLRANLPVKSLIGCSHWLMMDRPEEFCTVLWDFLDRVRR